MLIIKGLFPLGFCLRPAAAENIPKCLRSAISSCIRLHKTVEKIPKLNKVLEKLMHVMLAKVIQVYDKNIKYTLSAEERALIKAIVKKGLYNSICKFEKSMKAAVAPASANWGRD